MHTIIDSTFSNSLCSTISWFDLYSNELIDMHLGLIFWRSCMDLPSLGLGPLYCAELFWGWGLLLGISSSSPSSWSIEQCVVDMLRPKVASHVIFLRENRARAVVRLYFTLGQSFPFSSSLPRVRLGPWLRIRRPARTKFLQLLIWRWSCRPRAPLGGRLPTFLSDFWALSLGCAWSSCSQLRPAH